MTHILFVTTKAVSGKSFPMVVSNAIKRMGLSQAIYIVLSWFRQFASMRIGPMSILWTQKVEHFLSA